MSKALKPSTFSKTTSAARFHEHIPGETPLHVGKDYWPGLVLNVYRFPKINGGIPAPTIPDYGIAYLQSRGIYNTYYSFNDCKWTSLKLRGHTLNLFNKECRQNWQWRISDHTESPVVTNLIIDSDLLHKTAYETLGISSKDIELTTKLGFEDSLVSELCLALKAEAENRTPFGKIYGETAAQLLAVHLLKNYCTIRGSVSDRCYGLPRRQLSAVLEYIDGCLQQDISLETMAGLCGMSAYHFTRQFKLSMGMPPHQYVIRRRMERGRELLKHTQMTILNIALQVGYQSQSHFSSIFRRFYGVTPGEYRRNL